MNIWQFLDANWFQTYVFLALITAIISGAFITVAKERYTVYAQEEEEDDIDLTD